MKVLLKSTLTIAAVFCCAIFSVNAQSKPKLNKPNPDANMVFTAVEKAAEFPGGLEAFGNYMAKTVKYPAAARNKNVQGKVFVQFVVEKDGSLTGMKVLRGIGSGCDQEAMRAVLAGPKWKPGQQNGKVVRSTYTLPVSFQLAKV